MNAHIEAAKALLAKAQARYQEDLEKVHKKLQQAVGQDPNLMGDAIAIHKCEYAIDVPPVTLAPFEQPDPDPGQDLSLLAGDDVIDSTAAPVPTKPEIVDAVREPTKDDAYR